ncbi:MAG: PIN domain-containing protein [Proteobacteria bacterium]|nr:PIN domain-containing protein [Pseudomonadota bacterium]MDA0982541.1 PIN domain-containing protein [Pseudomonadota bacterium]
MTVLVDTPVWSLALRRSRVQAGAIQKELASLVEEGRATIIGPIRQELLSGVRERAQFERLREHLGTFPDLPLITVDYEEAVRDCNLCRARGVQGSHTDFLLCAVASRHGIRIFTTDRDFERYARVLPLALHVPRDEG